MLTLYAAGISPVAIAKRLNSDGTRGPDGCAWSPSTIHGHMSRGTGLLNNELYVGVYVWPKQRFRKDPRTGRRVPALCQRVSAGAIRGRTCGYPA